MNTNVGSVLFASALWLSLSAVYAQPHSGDFVADTKSRCKVWNPHPQPNETVNWSGGCVNGLAQGSGNLQWLRNDKPYEKDEGEWNGGRQWGRGRQEWCRGGYGGDTR